MGAWTCCSLQTAPCGCVLAAWLHLQAEGDQPNVVGLQAFYGVFWATHYRPRVVVVLAIVQSVVFMALFAQFYRCLAHRLCMLYWCAAESAAPRFLIASRLCLCHACAVVHASGLRNGRWG